MRKRAIIAILLIFIATGNALRHPHFKAYNISFSLIYPAEGVNIQEESKDQGSGLSFTSLADERKIDE